MIKVRARTSHSIVVGCVFSIMWRNYVICLRFLWRTDGKSDYQNDLYGDYS